MRQQRRFLDRRLNSYVKKAEKKNLRLPPEIWEIIRQYVHSDIPRHFTSEEMDLIVGQLYPSVRSDLKDRLNKVKIVGYKICEFTRDFVKVANSFCDTSYIDQNNKYHIMIQEILCDSFQAIPNTWVHLIHKVLCLRDDATCFHFYNSNPRNIFQSRAGDIMAPRCAQRGTIGNY